MQQPGVRRSKVCMSATVTDQRQAIRPVLRYLGCAVAWGWGLFGILGGLGLMITRGPWPPTNGWFVLFSGLTAWPPSAWALRRYRGINFPGWARFVVAFAIIVLGRFALKIEGRGNFLPWESR